MADVALARGLGNELALVAWLRWRLFRNLLRTSRGQWEVTGRIVLGVMLGGLALTVAVGFAAGAFFFAKSQRTDSLALLLWGIFLFWQFFPVMSAGATGGFDFRNLLRFPLRFGTFFLLDLIYGLLDPAALAAVLWLLSMAAGVFIARPGMLPGTVLVLFIFGAANLLLNRAIFSWLERLLARRRGREVFGAVLLLGLLSLQLIGTLGARWGRRVEPSLRWLRPVVRVLPPTLAGTALASDARGDPTRAFPPAILLMAYGLGFGLLLRHRLHAQYRGEDLGESRAPVAVPRGLGRAHVGSSGLDRVARFLPPPVAAVAGKELRYLLRSAPMLLNLVLPLFLVLFFSLAWTAPQAGVQGARVFTWAPEVVLPLSVGYAFLILAPFAHNSLGFDGRGIQLLFMAPVQFRDVLLAKNLVHALEALVQAGLVWIVVSIRFGAPKAMTAAATLAALLFVMLANYSAGNLLSLYFPRRLDFNVFRQRRAPAMTVLLGLALQVLAYGIVAAVFFLTRWHRRMWLAVVAPLALNLIAFVVYRTILERSSQVAAECRETLAAELCG